MAVEFWATSAQLFSPRRVKGSAYETGVTEGRPAGVGRMPMQVDGTELGIRID